MKANCFITGSFLSYYGKFRCCTWTKSLPSWGSVIYAFAREPIPHHDLIPQIERRLLTYTIFLYCLSQFGLIWWPFCRHLLYTRILLSPRKGQRHLALRGDCSCLYDLSTLRKLCSRERLLTAGDHWQRNVLAQSSLEPLGRRPIK